MNCVICDTPLRVYSVDPEGIYGTCKHCGAPFSHVRQIDGKPQVLSEWRCTLKESFIPLVRKFWDETHSRLPELDPVLRVQNSTDYERDQWNRWMSNKVTEYIEESVAENEEVLRKLA